MDVIFNCPHCEQELAVDADGAGSEISCPSCGETILIPQAEGGEEAQGHEAQGAINPIATSAEAREERHFSVPQHQKPAQPLIEKPLAPLEVAAKEGVHLRIKTIKRSDCIEVGKDMFDPNVTKALEKIGQDNLVAIHPISYSHQDLASRDWVTDYGVLIIYKG